MINFPFTCLFNNSLWLTLTFPQSTTKRCPIQKWVSHQIAWWIQIINASYVLCATRLLKNPSLLITASIRSVMAVSFGKEIEECPSCKKNFNFEEMKGQLKKVYLNLKVKCLSGKCSHDMDISNFKDHDPVCGFVFDFCHQCRVKSTRKPGEEHSCVKALIIELQKKITDLKQKMDVLKDTDLDSLEQNENWWLKCRN